MNTESKNENTNNSIWSIKLTGLQAAVMVVAITAVAAATYMVVNNK